MGFVKVSYSKLSTAEECELKFQHSYILKTPVKDLDHPSARLGQAFHETVEVWNQSNELTEENLLQIFPSSFKRKMSEPGMSPVDGRMLGILQSDGVKMLGKFWIRQVRERVVKPALFNEGAFEIPWQTELGNVLITGFIDRAMTETPRGTEVEDFKTSKTTATQAEVDSDLQMTFYSAAYRWMAKKHSDWPTKEDVVTLYFPRVDKKVSSTRGKEHFDDMKERIRKMIKLLGQTKFEAQPSERACQWCKYKRYCPAFRVVKMT